jgi:methyl-galactoside transport system permease protein
MNIFANFKSQFERFILAEKTRRIANWILDHLLYIILILFVIGSMILVPNIRSINQFFNIVIKVATYSPLAVGIAGAIVLTGTDLSAGRIVGLTAMISAVFAQSLVQTLGTKIIPGLNPLPAPVILLISMAIGFAIGAFNGFFVAKFSLHPFIVTLATQLIVYGGALFLAQANGNNGQAISNLDPAYKKFITGKIIQFGPGLIIPMYVIYAVIFVAVVWFLWNKTKFGRNMFAVGSNPSAANVSGVNVAMTIIMVHALAGLAYGYTGFIESARVSSNLPGTGFNYELDGITASVIGGVSFIGGTGKISGVILGVFLLQYIGVFLAAVGLTGGDIFNLVKGVIILVACTLDMRKYVVAK